MDILKLSLEFNGRTYEIYGDPLNKDEMIEGILNEAVRDGVGNPDSLYDLIAEDYISLGIVYIDEY